VSEISGELEGDKNNKIDIWHGYCYALHYMQGLEIILLNSVDISDQRCIIFRHGNKAGLMRKF
jgi:hypothetical protein